MHLMAHFSLGGFASERRKTAVIAAEKNMYAIFSRGRSKKRFDTEVIMKRTIITVVGHDTVGIIARVCTYLAENNINILDISQTIVQEYFNMMMIVDMNRAGKSFGEIAEELTKLGEQIGVIIKCQSEEIFSQMHRI